MFNILKNSVIYENGPIKWWPFDYFNLTISQVKEDVAKFLLKTLADLEGVRGVRSNCPSGTKLFQFRGEIYEKSGKMLKNTPSWWIWTPLPEILDPFLKKKQY